MSFGKKVILVVDDDPGVRQLIRFSIQDPGYEIIEAANGKEALEKANEQSIDLAILDALMPGIHGFELARQLREKMLFRNIKIFILTSVYKQRQYELEAKIKYGVDRYLLKPFQPEELRKLVEESLAE